MKRIWPICLLLALALFASGCAGYQAPAPAVEEKAAEEPPPAKEVGLTWEQKNIAFTPTTIEVEVGETVKIVNRDSVPHTFTALNPETGQVIIDKHLNGGESVTFTFGTKGEWKVWCRYHSDGTSSKPATSRMKGTVGVGVIATEEAKPDGGRYEY